MLDGVLIERRSAPGSRFDELRLSTVSSLSLQRLCDAIYPVKLSSTPERRFKKQVLLRETESERWTYEQISVPVVSDRDYVMHARLEQPPSTGHCAVSFVTEDDPARPAVPRVRSHPRHPRPLGRLPRRGWQAQRPVPHLQRPRRRPAGFSGARWSAQRCRRLHEDHPLAGKRPPN